jgi:hypothetical protein
MPIARSTGWLMDVAVFMGGFHQKIKTIGTTKAKAAPRQNVNDPWKLMPTLSIYSEDIRREMAKVYRETRFNKILPNNGSRLVYMLINILKAYESPRWKNAL